MWLIVNTYEDMIIQTWNNVISLENNLERIKEGVKCTFDKVMRENNRIIRRLEEI